MTGTTDGAFVEMRVAKVVGLGGTEGEPLDSCVVLDEREGTGAFRS